MFHNIPDEITARMSYLEEIDTRDRTDGTDRMKRLRQIPPDTGKFIALLAASAPEGNWIEIGASAGYSTLWLVLACRQRNKRITTFEILPDKAALARETIEQARVEQWIDLVEGDACKLLESYADISFCFLDAEKEIYAELYELVVPRLVPGGILVADNAISHGKDLAPLIARATSDLRVDALVVPIGKGELLCRKIG